MKLKKCQKNLLLRYNLPTSIVLLVLMATLIFWYTNNTIAYNVSSTIAVVIVPLPPTPPTPPTEPAQS